MVEERVPEKCSILSRSRFCEVCPLGSRCPCSRTSRVQVASDVDIFQLARILVTMGVWLGKNILGQTDEIRHEVTLSTHPCVVLPRAIEPASQPPRRKSRCGSETTMWALKMTRERDFKVLSSLSHSIS